MKPDPGFEVKLTVDEQDDLYEARRNRDMISSRNPPKVKDGKPEKPLLDKQLDKAMDLVRSKIKPDGK